MPRLTARERRDRYQREYSFQKRHGKSFFPHAVFHDTIVSLIGGLIALHMWLVIRLGVTSPPWSRIQPTEKDV